MDDQRELKVSGPGALAASSPSKTRSIRSHSFTGPPTRTCQREDAPTRARPMAG
ncbi:hypothetical protein [Streptomyces sp. NPDC001970]